MAACDKISMDKTEVLQIAICYLKEMVHIKRSEFKRKRR